MTTREGACCTLSMHPVRLSIHDLLASDVVADEVDELPRDTRKNFLERLEDEGIDQEVVEGREVGADRHVVEVGIGLIGSERRVHELAIAAGERDAPGVEVLLECLELARGHVVTEPA